MRITVVRMRYFLDNTKQMLIRVTEDLPSIQNCFNIQSSELNSISESQETLIVAEKLFLH